MTDDRLDRVEERARKSEALLAWHLVDGTRRKWRDDVLALVEIARATREIRDTAKWYADNDQRLPHEVDHALCVEIYALADNALARLDKED